MPVYSCPLCGRAVDEEGEPFEEAGLVVAHVDQATDSVHEGHGGAALRDVVERTADGESTAQAPTVTYDGEERPVEEVIHQLDEDVRKLRTKFDRVVQEQRNDAEGLQEVVERHMFAIQEMQAGLEKLAEELDKDVEYQYEL